MRFFVKRSDFRLANLVVVLCVLSFAVVCTTALQTQLPLTRYSTRHVLSSLRSFPRPASSTSLPLFSNTNEQGDEFNRRRQRRRDRIWPFSRRATSLLSTLSSLSSDATSTEVSISAEDDSHYDPFATANDIAPKTKPLPKSMAFYAAYILERFHKMRVDKKFRSNQRGQRRAMWNKLNEQRKNVIGLANYTRHIVAPSFLFLFLGALMTSIIPLYYSKSLQSVSTLSGTRADLMSNLIKLGVASTLGALFTGARGSLFWIGGSRTNYNIRVKLHRSLLLQDAAFFDENETGYLLSRLNSDVNRIGAVISYHVNIVCRQFAQFVFGSVYMFRIAPRLSMWTFAGIGLVAYASAVYGDFARDLSERVQDTFADATAVAETSFSMSETIRAYDGVEVESDRFEHAQSKALELEEVQAWGYGSHKFVSDTLQTALHVGLLLACYTLGKAGGLEAGKLTTFLFYSNFVLESSNEVGDQWAKIQSAVGASTSVFDLIQREPGVRDPEESMAPTLKSADASNGVTVTKSASPPANGIANGSAKPLIAMSNMTVTYGAMERPALDGVDVEIMEGDRIAIVGRSGSGKSTMLRSILRFYDPSSGSISLEGRELSSMSRSELAKKLAVVQQEPQLFPMSLLENVLYNIPKDATNVTTGEPCYSDAKRKSAMDSLSLVGLSLGGLGLDLDTRVGEGGRSLSGGQRQRVAISRAVIRDPKVLLLDEPTAALDSESERKVVDSLRSAARNIKSIVMVTHRLGVIRSLGVNRVIVLDKGRIVEMGHPEELLQKVNGLYAALAREQGILADRREECEVSTSSEPA